MVARAVFGQKNLVELTLIGRNEAGLGQGEATVDRQVRPLAGATEKNSDSSKDWHPNPGTLTFIAARHTPRVTGHIVP